MPEDADLKVVFVCWGNICRSPIAERVAERMAADAGIEGVAFTSAGTSSEELGAPIDPRAGQVLRAHGYRAVDHVAHRIDAVELDGADLVIAMEDLHVDRLRLVSRDAEVSLLTDFDPDAVTGSGVPDPWYGADSGFEDTLATVEAAMPGVLDRVRGLHRR